MATPNPLETTYASPPPQVSKKTFTIAGILTTVFGLEELPSQLSEVACLWLLHPRLQTQACMEPIAGSTIGDWNKRIREGRAGRSPKGLIAVSFDQRNHGTREIDQIANEAWRSGNERHAQDMFSTYRKSLLVFSTTRDIPKLSLSHCVAQIVCNCWSCLVQAFWFITKYKLFIIRVPT